MTEDIKTRRSIPGIVLDLILASIGLVVLGPCTSIAWSLLLMKFAKADSYVLTTACMYFATGLAWVVVLLWMRFTKKNRPTLETLGPRARGNTIKMLLLGFGIGFALNGICILAAVLHGDVSIQFESFRLLPMLLILVAVFSQSSAEELICRGYYYQRAKRATGSAVAAVFLNSLVFAGCHVRNPGITPLALFNIVVLGILLSLFVYYFDSIWCAFGAHAAWNYTQNIIFGLPNSGRVAPFSMCKLDNGARDSFFYNVGFGVESTVFAILLELLAIAVIICIGRRYKQNQARDAKA